MSLKKIVTAAGFVGAAALAGASPVLAQKMFDGVTVNVMTFTGPQVAKPLQRRGKEFGEKTGAKINVVTVPFSDLYQKLLTDWATGTNSIDAGVFAPQWMAQGVRREAETVVKTQIERLLASMDVVTREEFEAVRDMAAAAREENESLKARIAALETKTIS